MPEILAPRGQGRRIVEFKASLVHSKVKPGLQNESLSFSSSVLCSHREQVLATIKMAPAKTLKLTESSQLVIL